MPYTPNPNAPIYKCNPFYDATVLRNFVFESARNGRTKIVNQLNSTNSTTDAPSSLLAEMHLLTEEQVKAMSSSIVHNMKLLFCHYQQLFFDSNANEPANVEPFLDPLRDVLEDYCRIHYNELSTNAQQKRSQVIKDQITTWKRIRLCTTRASFEFFDDPALLIRIFSFCSVEELMNVREANQYLNQFLIENWKLILQDHHFAIKATTQMNRRNVKFNGSVQKFQEYYWRLTSSNSYKMACVIAQLQFVQEYIAAKRNNIEDFVPKTPIDVLERTVLDLNLQTTLCVIQQYKNGYHQQSTNFENFNAPYSCGYLFVLWHPFGEYNIPFYFQKVQHAGFFLKPDILVLENMFFIIRNLQLKAKQEDFKFDIFVKTSEKLSEQVPIFQSLVPQHFCIFLLSEANLRIVEQNTITVLKMNYWKYSQVVCQHNLCVFENHRHYWNRVKKYSAAFTLLDI